MRSRLFALLVAAACGSALAQTATLPDGPRVPSLPEASFERIDEAMRDRVATSDSADALFVRGLQATMDPGARVASYAEAWRRQPAELLFLASFADACMVRAVPAWPDCAAVDPVSRWAARDADNAVPRVLLAERARQRGDLPGMREQLGYAADLARFVSYRPRGGPAVWRVLSGIPAVAREPEAPFAAAALGSMRADVATTEATQLCQNGAPGVGVEVAEPCKRLARAMADHADTFGARLIGLALAWSWAGDDAERRRLAAERDRVTAASLACGEARLAWIERLNRDAASRDAARRAEAASLDDAATLDEPAACARWVARTKAANLI
ncbi:MAG: hypothetical protein ABI585_15920 [Betaproteobacteria bacterium]